MKYTAPLKPWIHSPAVDGLFILLPMIVPAILVMTIPALSSTETAVSPWLWLLLVVGVDVSHVYSTLYRTYFDPQEFAKYKVHLILIPLAAWAAGVILFMIGGWLFWRAMAYLAVFHFVRQQYGFFSIYARSETRTQNERRLDSAVIYASTLFPIVWWHCHQPREFHWFVEGDFLAISAEIIGWIAAGIYLLLLALYTAKEISKITRGSSFNLPKNLVVAGTAVSWFTGIVLFNGDLAFTFTNVVSHGIPYMALIWIYGSRKNQADIRNERPGWLRNMFRLQYLPVFIGILFLLGFVEEALWDTAVWRDHGVIFSWMYSIPQLEAQDLLAIIVPLLAVPQVTHYVIDGFIWKVRRPDSDLSQAGIGREK